MGLPVGTIILILVAVLVFFGVLHRVLDRMRLSDRAALVIVIAMAAGTFLDISIPGGAIPIRLNVGGALVPLAVIIWLIATADEASDKTRAIFSAIITGAVVWGLTKVMNPEEQFMRISPMLLFGIAAGIIAALSGRSRRRVCRRRRRESLLSDGFHWIRAGRDGPRVRFLWRCGAFDATVIAGVVAGGRMEFVGEAREHMVKTPKGEREQDDRRKE